MAFAAAAAAGSAHLSAQNSVAFESLAVNNNNSRRPSRNPSRNNNYPSSSALHHEDSRMSKSQSQKFASSASLHHEDSRLTKSQSQKFQSMHSVTQEQIDAQAQEQLLKQQAALGVQVSELELENIRRIFKQFDADGSNSIDVEELALVMTSLGVQMDEVQLRELVEQVTSEGEQELTFEEFVSLITLWKEAAQYKLFEGDGFKSLAKQHVDQALQSESIVPDTPLRAAWDVLVCIVSVLYWIFCLLLDCYKIEGAFDPTGLIVGDIVCTLFLIADVFVCSRTAIMRDGRTIDDTDDVWLNYRKTWLIPDVLAALPLDLILTASGAPLIAALVLRHLRLLKLIKLPYLWRSSDVMPITSDYITFHFHLLPIFQLLVSFIIMVHGFAVGWVLLKQSQCTDPLVEFHNVSSFSALMGDCVYPYTPAVYFIIYSLSTVGLGDIQISGEAEYWYACLVLVGAMATNGVVVAKLVEILQRADIKKEQRSKIRETLAVLEHYHIASQLQTEILQFQAHVFENNLTSAYESIISGLPAEMRNNISLFVRMKLVSVVPLFQESHFMLRIAVAQVLTNAVARPEQYVCVAGQHIDGLCLIAYGFADTFGADGAYRQTLRSGDYFGEEALVGSGNVAESVKALTFCDLWMLQTDTFNTMLGRFPKFRRTVELLRSAEEAASHAAISGSVSRADASSEGGNIESPFGSGMYSRKDSGVRRFSTGENNNSNSSSTRKDSTGKLCNPLQSVAAGGDEQEMAAVEGQHQQQQQQQQQNYLAVGDDTSPRRRSAVTFEASGNNIVHEESIDNSHLREQHHEHDHHDHHEHAAAGGRPGSAGSSSRGGGGTDASSSSVSEAEELVQPSMSVAEIHRFLAQVRSFKSRLKNVSLYE